MSSILDAQRRNQPNEAVALVAPPAVSSALLVGLSSGLSLALAAIAFLLWQQSTSDTLEAAREAELQQVISKPAKPTVTVATIPEFELGFELRPLPSSDDLEKVDLLALRQEKFEALLAHTESQPQIQYQPLAQTPKQPVQQAALPVEVKPAATPKPQAEKQTTTATVANPTAEKNATEKGLEQRFAAAVQATQVLAWKDEADPTNYDTAPMMGALAPDVLALIPSLTFNSHVFSSDPTRRYISLNNVELAEGDFVTKNIELVAIRLDDIVLRVAGNLCRLNALSDWG
ncbi:MULTISPECIES: general secretion pathway protein GspB [unclassified Agarivorans]|uniref:general secretion pathway protein GspB n=1 Tax=unclassified Agarivorans TaxID=2636026 RepID=UPI0026E20FEA|nr:MULTISPECIES: general secretion pathway protein GspB [unclassified Agarivorans]MDO6685250.1 general secretion pathway protein GspB [Agarivorans sp. 3_MG-2023]MDO6715578.1 general secretion pathway protein GspB [Agarivorans sp. 2_MG-2023]